jgi:hypothetical protein
MSDNTMGKQGSTMNKPSSKVNVRQYNGGKQSSKMNKQSSKVNVRQYNGENRAVK